MTTNIHASDTACWASTRPHPQTAQTGGLVTPRTEQTAQTERHDDNDLCHYVCDCNADIALCGQNLAIAEFDDSDDVLLCVVCIDMDDHPCRLCGQGGDL